MKPLPLTLAALAAAAAFGTAHADTVYVTETFEGAAASNGAYGAGPIAGTGVEVVNGSVWIGPGSDGHGNILDLGSGWYTGNVDPVTNIGSSTAQSIATFDLLAGHTYQLTFDYSRQTWSGGNGPFDTALTVAFGAHAVTYHDVAGFFYGSNWQAGSLSFTPTADELGVHVVFTAFGPPGYSGMTVDNIALVGLAPVPEPQPAALLMAGLACLGIGARRRASRTIDAS